MNIIQMRDRVDFYNDRFQSPRFSDRNYYDAIRSAIVSLFKDKVENKKLFRKYSFESSEMLRRELYTLIKPATITPVANVVAYPADYDYFIEMNTTVSGITNYCKATTYNKKGPLEDNPLRRSRPGKTYCVETSTGLEVLCGTGTFTSAQLTYLKKPNIVTWGNENNKINAFGALVVSTQYIVYDDCVENGVNYYSGDIFAAATTTLTSGIVIPVSVIVSCDLPDNTHDEICRKASDIMQLTIEDYNKASFLDREIEKQ